MFLSKLKWFLLSTVSLLNPLIHLRRIHGYWNPNWLNHIWPIGYAGQYFKHNLVFYAYLLYRLCDVLSSFMGPDLALWVPIVIAALLQIYLAYRLTVILTENRLWAWTAATLVTLTIYPLTKIYHCAGVPEFVAGTFIQCVVLAWILALISKRREKMIFYVFLSGLSLSLVIDTHPILAVYEMAVVVLILLPSIPHLKMAVRDRKAPGFTLHGASIFLTFVAAPWVYITQMFIKKFSVAQNPEVYFYPEPMYNLWMRFGLLPMARRSFELGIHIDTPYLDTKIKRLLLILIVGILFLGRGNLFTKPEFKMSVDYEFGKNMFVFSVVGFFIFTIMYFNPGIYNHLPEVFKQVQMAYRLVNFQNVLLFLSFLSLCFINGRFFAEFKATNLVFLLIICLTISFCGLADKYRRIRRVFMERCTTRKSELFLTMREKFPLWNYTAIDIKNLDESNPVSNEMISFPIEDGTNFSSIGPRQGNVKTRGWYKTNVAAFVWNHLYENGVEIPPIFYQETDYRLAIQLEPGAHSLSTEVVADPRWFKLRELYFFTIALGLLICLFQFAFPKLSVKKTC